LSLLKFWWEKEKPATAIRGFYSPQYQPPGIWLSYRTEHMCRNRQTSKTVNPKPRRQRHGTGLLFKTGWCSIGSLSMMRGSVSQ
jgi:hypothetical protein